MIKNICCLLLVAAISGLLCWNAGFLAGRKDINDRLVVATYNTAFSDGVIFGGSRTMYLLFEDFIKLSPYALVEPEDENE